MASEPIKIKDDDKGYSVNQLSVPAHYREFLDSIIISKGLIKDRIEKLAQEIHEDYEGKRLHIICILKGGEKVFADLTNSLHVLNSRYGQKSIPITYDFIKASSYINTNTKGTVSIDSNIIKKESIEEKHILLVEDIIDTGRTIAALKKIILEHNPSSLKVVSLLVKRLKEGPKFIPDYVGFSIPDKFVVDTALITTKNSGICST
jgi:hypoxanthine phosphoribosyltransferase